MDGIRCGHSISFPVQRVEYPLTQVFDRPIVEMQESTRLPRPATVEEPQGIASADLTRTGEFEGSGLHRLGARQVLDRDAGPRHEVGDEVPRVRLDVLRLGPEDALR